jgi:DNA helicase HerA-like ATPase
VVSISDRENKIGRVVATEISPSFEAVAVRLDPGKSVRPGQLLFTYLKGDLDSPNKMAILRVSSAKEHNPYEDPLSSHVRDRFQLESTRDKEDLLKKFTVALTVPIEIVGINPDGSVYFEDPAYVIPAGSEVYDTADSDLVAKVLGFVPPESPDGIEIGTTVGSEAVKVVLSANAVMPRHVLIVGSTGTGKSWCLGKITEELHRIGVPHVNVDVHGEMISATEELGGTTVVPGWDPLFPSENRLTVKLSSLDEPEILEMIPLTHDLHLDIVTKALINLKQSGKEFTVDSLLREALAVADSYGAKRNTLDIIEARINQLKNVPILGPGFDWKRFLGKEGAIVNVDCRGLQRSQLRIVVGAIARELYKLRSRNEIKPLVLSIDEAHLFLPSSGGSASSAVLGEIVRMGRHVGLGVILVTQSPADLDRHAAKITNTRLIFAIEHSELGSIQGLLADTPEDLVRNIPRLRVGTCLLVGSRETVKHATVVKVGERRTTHGGVTPKMKG